ncbi:MAG TPA: ABC transporter permease [Gaiellaceae bacterium]|nr:ABC transporter permease [Gaiellaceae bacterium]HET8653514.1 ABC transporter permease [Gaiellaceae bacterium]
MTVPLRIFFVGGITAYRGLINWLSPWIFVPTLIVAPIFQILLFVYIGRSAGVQSDEFFVIGNAVQYASIPCLFSMTHAIAGERYQQTLAYILVSPAGRLPLFLGRALPVICNAMLVAAFSLVVSGLLLGIDVPPSAWAPIALVIVVSSFACTGLGLICAALGLRIRETAVLNNVIFGLLLIFTGANVPIDELPGWMQAISNRIPLTHGIEAARELADGSSIGDVDGLIATEFAIGVVYTLVGYAALRVMEHESRKRASIQIA